MQETGEKFVSEVEANRRSQGGSQKMMISPPRPGKSDALSLRAATSEKQRGRRQV